MLFWLSPTVRSALTGWVELTFVRKIEKYAKSIKCNKLTNCPNSKHSDIHTRSFSLCTFQKKALANEGSFWLYNRKCLHASPLYIYFCSNCNNHFFNHSYIYMCLYFHLKLQHCAFWASSSAWGEKKNVAQFSLQTLSANKNKSRPCNTCAAERP